MTDEELQAARKLCDANIVTHPAGIESWRGEMIRLVPQLLDEVERLRALWSVAEVAQRRIDEMLARLSAKERP